VREKLPNRRACETLSFVCNDLDYTASVGCFPDGRLAEIFLSNAKAGSHSDAAARDSAVVCSLALQSGVSVDAIRHALLRDTQGRHRRSAARSICWQIQQHSLRAPAMILIEHQTTADMDDGQALPPFWDGNTWHVVRRFPNQKTLWRRIDLTITGQASSSGKPRNKQL
jgi:hypothetical protein